MSNFTTSEKISYFENQLQKAMSRFTTKQNNPIDSLIKKYWQDYESLKKNSTDHEHELIKLTSRFILELEEKALSTVLVNSLKQHNIYQMIYQNSYRGQYSQLNFFTSEQPLGVDILEITKKGIIVTATMIALFALISLTGVTLLLPLATALFAASFIYLTGLTYGVINDIFATKMNLSYFLLGHQPTQKSFFVSNDPNIQAIGWGIIATQALSIIAGVIFGITTLCAGAPALFVLPALLLATPVIAGLAELYAQYKVGQYKKNGLNLFGITDEKKKEKMIFDKALNGNEAIFLENQPLTKANFGNPVFLSFLNKIGMLNSYQVEGLAELSASEEMTARWFANSDRNLAGYISLPLLAISALVCMTTLTSALAPAILFSPAFSVILPIGAAILAVGALGFSLNYALTNQCRQIDNASKLLTFEQRWFSSNKAKLYLPPDLNNDNKQEEQEEQEEQEDIGLCY